MLADDQKIELPGVEGILVYRDFSDPNVFYCSSTRPAVARDGGAYQFTIVLYDPPPLRGKPAGMLSLVVDLAPDKTMMQNVESQIRAKTPGAQFYPMPWTSGAVVAAIIGGDPVFGVPSLLGNNSAALAVGLTTDQYLLLKNSGKNPESPPISVVYSLSYEAFREKQKFSIEFNESKFRDWIQKKCSANFLFISFENVQTFYEMRQSGVIRVVLENQTIETPPEGFQRAFLSSLQSLLDPLPRFAPPAEAGDNPWPIGFSCSAVRDIQNISRRLDCNMQISGAVARKVFIQGGLAGLREAWDARPEIMLLTGVSFTQKLTVRCHAAFDDKPLDEVNVTIEPRDAARYSRVFNKTNSAEEWPIELVHPPGTDSDYTYRCVSYFRDYRPESTSGLVGIRREQAFLDILPSDFYAYRLYSVSVAKDKDEFPWDLLKSVKLTLKGPASLVFKPEQLVLSQASPSGQISAFASERANLDDVGFTALYQPESGVSFALDGLPSGSTIFLNPFLRRVVSFQASAGFDWQRTSKILVKVDPSKEGPQLWAAQAGSLTLTKNASTSSFAYWYTDDRKLKYKRAFFQNGQQMPSASFDTSEARVIVSDQN